MPRGREILFAAGAAWGALAVWLADRLSEAAVDDFYITYRYAWNLLHGLGFVFNPGEKVFGVTDPGFALLLAGVGSVVRIPIPALGTLLTGAALAGIALVLLAEGRERNRLPEALLAGTLTLVSSCLWVNQGAGVFAALFLLLLAARLGARRPVVAGLLAGLAVWMRPDAGLGVAALALLLGLAPRTADPEAPEAGARRWRLPLGFAAAAALVTLAGLATAYAYFGTFLPNTLAAKQGIASASAETWAGLERFWARLVPVIPRHWGPRWPWIAAAGLLGHVPFWRRSGRAGRTLAAYSLALAVAYPLLGVPFSFWYVVPTAAGALYGLVFLAGEAGRALGGLLQRKTGREAASRLAALAAAALLLAPLLASLLPANVRWLRHQNWQRHLLTYRAAALWLRDNSDESDSVAYVEIGVWGYYSRRTVVDLLGLVTPSSIPYARVGDRVGAFLKRPTVWVVSHSRGSMGPVIERGWFSRAYEERVRFDEGDGRELVLYRQIARSAIPDSRPPRGGGPGNAGRLRPRPARHARPPATATPPPPASAERPDDEP